LAKAGEGAAHGARIFRRGHDFRLASIASLHFLEQLSLASQDREPEGREAVFPTRPATFGIDVMFITAVATASSYRS